MFDLSSSNNGFFGDFINQGLSGLGLQDGATAAKTLGGLIKTATQDPGPSQPASAPPAPVKGMALPSGVSPTQLMVVGLAAAVLVYLMVRK